LSYGKIYREQILRKKKHKIQLKNPFNFTQKIDFAGIIKKFRPKNPKAIFLALAAPSSSQTERPNQSSWDSTEKNQYGLELT